MNREIKFRGFSDLQKYWVYGHYIESYNHHEIHRRDEYGCMHCWVVQNDSIGQCTGLKNHHGIDIHEDDVIHVEGYGNYIVEWFEGGFITEFLGELTEQYLNCNFFDYSDNGVIKCTVIGNRFQNPELLERSNEQS